MPTKFLASLLLLTTLASCSKKEIVPERFYPKNDFEVYWHSLKQANLLSTGLGRDWMAAAEKPFEEQIEVGLPYQESFEISSLIPEAHGYQFKVKRGQKVLVNIDLLSSDSSRLFVDLFRLTGDTLKPFIPVASADSTLDISFEPRRDASYLLRIQPELLRGGHFSITIENTPTLAFPVAGKNKYAIGSVFGDPRDGGRREHHGVDIFAKRHTPILAPIEATVRFVGTRGIGGKVVWLRDYETGNSLYFAHLQDQKVKRYQKVYPGDTIGTVGNTGNARTTPPHLHFGIYNNGPINPYPFIVPAYTSTGFTSPDTTSLGAKIRIQSELVLQAQMQETAAILDTLIADDTVRLLAINHRFLRVRTEEGVKGFLRKSDFSQF